MMTDNYCDDNSLITEMRADDSEAFRTLYLRYWKPILHFAHHKTQDLMMAEDIVQDIFVSLWNRRHELVIHRNLQSYLMVSVKYRIIKLLDRQRTIRLEDNLSTLEIVDDSTQEYIEFEELRNRLSELITALPEKYQIVYRLYKEEEMSHREIAERMQMTEQAVNSRLVRARKSISLSLQHYFANFFL